ncbi:MAG: nucleotidyl transferase AbiEii/AbiGii toxin family protein [Acidimicrobiia bacterium]
MIPAADIVAWSRVVPWPTREQVEQDLVLSRLIVEIANDDYLGGELIFRGGTCLHKLALPAPWRYSEDLDYVRRTAGGIADLTRALTRIGTALDMEVRTRIGLHPKVFLRAPFESGSGQMRVKIEVNTFERAPAREAEPVPFAVTSPWFAGAATVAAFTAPEMLATKIRALFQRSKGRDLFDFWLGLEVLNVSADQILDCFAPYRPTGLTARRAILNLQAKLDDRDFRNDLNGLVASWPNGYSIERAAELVIQDLLSRL